MAIIGSVDSAKPAPGPGPSHLSYIDSLRSLPPADWDRLVVGRSFYASRQWLLTAEDHDDFTAQYLTLAEGGVLRAAVPIYEAAKPPHNDRYDPWALVVRHLAPHLEKADLYPCLMVGSRSGYTNDAFLASPSLDGPEMFRRLLAPLTARLRSGEIRSLTFPYLTTAALVELHAVVGGATDTVLVSDADTRLVLPGRGFSDYLAALGGQRRRKVRRERAAFDRAGYRIELGALTGRADEFAPMLASLQARYGASSSIERMTRYLRAQERELSDRATVFIAVRGEYVVGFALFFRMGTSLWGRIVGFDYERVDRDAAVYFNLAYYHPIEYAYANGFAEVHWGAGSYDAKLGRGARLDLRWSVTILNEPWDRTAKDRARARNEETLRRWLEQFPVSVAEIEAARGIAGLGTAGE